MHFIVTGATGFIGRAVVRTALARGHAVTAIVRDAERARTVLNTHENLFFTQTSSFEDAVAGKIMRGDDRLIHLAWGDVGKYTDPKNLLENIQPQFSFLKKMAQAGVTHQTIAGSCLEYGKIEGCLVEDMPSAPACYYGLAKTMLFDMLGLLKENGVALNLNWLRFFYVYGEGQRAGALLPQLYAAVARGDETFNMSKGDQKRDFVHVDTAAHNTLVAAEQAKELGIVNTGNGTAVKVLDFIKAALAAKGKQIKLNTGFYDYPPYEPFSFYADTVKLKTIVGMKNDATFIL